MVANAESISSHVLSVYAANGGKIHHLGSAIALAIENRFALMTAAHLLESGRSAEQFFVLSRDFHKTVSLNRRFLKSSDDGDLAIAGLKDTEFRTLSVSSISYKEFLTLPPAVKGRGVGTVGWPNTKNEINQHRKLSPTPMFVSGPSVRAADIDCAEELDRKFVYQRYRPKEAIGQDGVAINAPKLRGLSGGLTVDLGDPLDSNSLLGGGAFPNWHPVGILTDFDSKAKVIRSTRPHEFLRSCIENNQLPSLFGG